LNNINHSNLKIRLEELESFKVEVQSKTTLELLNKATAYTKWSYQEHMKLMELVITYLKFLMESNNRVKNSLVALAKPMSLESEDIPISDEDLIMTEVFIDGFSKEVKLNRLLKIDIYDCTLNFSKMLFDEIYKINYAKINKNIFKNLLVHLFKKIDIFNSLDDIDVIRKANPKYKIKKELQSIDESMRYIEEYNEVLLDWIAYSKAFQKRLLIEIKA